MRKEVAEKSDKDVAIYSGLKAATQSTYLLGSVSYDPYRNKTEINKDLY
jgi:hypothetical protein